jgi:hypothetical protein
MNEQTPLGPEDLLLLTGSAFDPSELHRAIAPLGLKAHITTRFALVRAEVERLVIEHGISHVLRLARLQEAVMPPTADVPAVVRVLGGMLDRLAPTTNFVVVDRYLLPCNAIGDYGQMLGDLLLPLARRVTELTIVTGTKYDAALLQQLVLRLGSVRSCAVRHQMSDCFHDRFWIADRSRGIFVGTSLNGLGRKYALADVMDSTDVIEIVRALKAEGLLA